MIVRADVKCYLCGRVTGEALLDLRQPRRLLAFTPAAGLGDRAAGNRGAGGSVPRRLRCLRCAGPVFLEEWTPVRPASERAEELAVGRLRGVPERPRGPLGVPHRRRAATA